MEVQRVQAGLIVVESESEKGAVQLIEENQVDADYFSSEVNWSKTPIESTGVLDVVEEENLAESYLLL